MHCFDAPKLGGSHACTENLCAVEASGSVGGGGVGLDKDERLDVQHDEAADDHDDESKRHDRSAWAWAARDDEEKADLDGRDADVDRDAAEIDRDRARLERDRDK
jgi:hypothetical protein